MDEWRIGKSEATWILEIRIEAILCTTDCQQIISNAYYLLMFNA